MRDLAKSSHTVGFHGALGENRTPTSLRTTDFESAASTNSATRANMVRQLAIRLTISNHTDLHNKFNRKKFNFFEPNEPAHSSVEEFSLLVEVKTALAPLLTHSRFF